MKITFLGTGSMVPTKERNQVAILISYKDEKILVDCGEATQRQLRIAKISPSKITKILITHWHSDHTLGLPGLINTMGQSNYSKTLEIYGPKGSKNYIENINKCFVRQTRIKYKVKDINEGVFFENEDYKLESKKLSHGCLCLGYNFIEKDKRNIDKNKLKKFNIKPGPILKKLQEGKDITINGKKIKANDATVLKKGKKVSIVMDTLPIEGIVKFSKDSDIMICESTHLDELKEKSKTYKHMTAKQAAGLAKKAKVKKLVLIHYSQRYNDLNEIKKEAESVFKNVICSKDFMELVV